MNRFMIYYDSDSPPNLLEKEMKRLKKTCPEPLHFVVSDFMLLVKSPKPIGQFIDTAGFTDKGGMNGFVVQIYNINGWYRTQLWDWYYSN